MSQRMLTFPFHLAIPTSMGIILAFWLFTWPAKASAAPELANTAQTVDSDSDIPKLKLKEITVQSKPYELKDHPGATSVITQETIEVFKPISTIDVLRRVPGIHAPDEYGRGLRPNIGIRGLNPNRSQNVLLLFDGVSIQPAVYGAPFAYFNVPVEQVERIEILRGGASALYGPNTVAGVINYISYRPPREQQINIRETIRAGEFFSSTVSYGNTFNETGVQFLYTNKTGSLVRDQTGTQLNDVSLRFTFPIGHEGEGDLRLTGFVEESETPGGLTVAQFDKDPNQSQRSHDDFFGRRWSATFRYTQPISNSLKFDGTTYANSFQRDWFIANGPDATATGNTQFLRDFFVAGVRPTLDWSPNSRMNIIGGGKIHFEEQEDIVRLGNSANARNGTIDQEAELTSLAGAVFTSAKIEPIEGLIISPGIRYERVTQEREVGLRAGTGGVGGSLTTEEVVGGVGLLYHLPMNSELFGNYSRNFQPPTFGEATDPLSGTTNDLNVETSNSYEVGFRSTISKLVYLEATGFWIDFDNQIIAEAGVLRNAQKTRHRGIEGTINAGPWHGLSANVNTTILETEFLKGANKGNDLPSAPELLFNWAVSYEVETSLGLARIQLDGRFVDEQFTDAANTVAESPDGTNGQLPSYHVTNLRLDFGIPNTFGGDMNLFAGVTNLTNVEYRVRRQAFVNGIIPGLTRIFYGGVSLEF
ncbi:MAG: TonB-dependent receptor [Nitrospirales bacterium]|nr:MAG: TonB-dependent receptor [Nitrospirales bacterium]